jgi:hypothetical protein
MGRKNDRNCQEALYAVDLEPTLADRPVLGPGQHEERPRARARQKAGRNEIDRIPHEYVDVIGPSRDEDSQDAKQYQEQEVDEYLADACRAVRLGGDYVSPVIRDPLCCPRNVGEIQMHGAADDLAQQQSYHCDCRIESPILQPIA